MREPLYPLNTGLPAREALGPLVPSIRRLPPVRPSRWVFCSADKAAARTGRAGAIPDGFAAGRRTVTLTTMLAGMVTQCFHGAPPVSFPAQVWLGG